MDAEFVHDVASMSNNRVKGNIKDRSYLFVALAFGQKLDDLPFTGRQFMS